uniref:GST N-terminal domain-containing protein n=1 Tax=Odontella aurita TaxID=265563 RepID=A0A7S4K7U7_9STRA|mmetsp:Transcript_63559/g.187633  ORF Transcript_63559/g.187633 Transcript_63559/m.187633 type:complete len:455 (+) Transcript_63559:104-1468(+)
MHSLSLAFLLQLFSSAADAFTTGRGSQAASSSSALRMSVPNSLDTLTSGLASIARLPFGVTVSDTAKRLEAGGGYDLEIATLYDVENNRECRKVRERISELDLIVQTVVPAATQGRVFNDPSYPYALPSGSEIPRLVAKNGGASERVLVGSEAIVSYLDENFADNELSGPSDSQQQQVIDTVLEAISFLPGLLRAGRGSEVCSAASATASLPVPRPTKPLILYSYEGNQFCRLVREVLTELDLPYELRSAGKSSPRRSDMTKLTGGSSQCPYLIDENADTAMFESADIIEYLYKTYALWTPPNEILESVSAIVTPLLKPIYKVLAPLQAGSNGEDTKAYNADIANTKAAIEKEISSSRVVVYTYSLSPFCTEATNLLKTLDIEYKEISLGKEWIPGLIDDPIKRAALGEMTGQTSLPHVFVGGKSIGGIFSGSPGLVPALEQGILMKLINDADK